MKAATQSAIVVCLAAGMAFTLSGCGRCIDLSGTYDYSNGPPGDPKGVDTLRQGGCTGGAGGTGGDLFGKDSWTYQVSGMSIKSNQQGHVTNGVIEEGPPTTIRFDNSYYYVRREGSEMCENIQGMYDYTGPSSDPSGVDYLAQPIGKCSGSGGAINNQPYNFVVERSRVESGNSWGTISVGPPLIIEWEDGYRYVRREPTLAPTPRPTPPPTSPPTPAPTPEDPNATTAQPSYSYLEQVDVTV